MNQREKAERFQALHKGPAAFVIANPWDGGSARILAGLGFQALATSSGAAAGVRRISLASSLWRASMTGLVEAAREVKEQGTFGYLERSLATPDLYRFLQE